MNSKLLNKNKILNLLLVSVGKCGCLCVVACSPTSNSANATVESSIEEELVEIATIVNGDFHEVSIDLQNELNSIGVNPAIYGSIVYGVKVPASQVDSSKNAIRNSRSFIQGYVVIKGGSESAGINWLGIENGRVLQRKPSQ